MHRLRRGKIKTISAEKTLLIFISPKSKTKRRVLVITGGVGGSCQEGPAHHRRFNIFALYLSSRDFRTPRAFSLIRTLGLLPHEVFPSYAGILWDRSLLHQSPSLRFSSILAFHVLFMLGAWPCMKFHLLATLASCCFLADVCFWWG